MNTIKYRLKELRKEKNLTQKEIADALGISTTCYAGYEQGYREPNADMIISICLYFGKSADYLIGLEDENGIKEIDKQDAQQAQVINNTTTTDNRNYQFNNIHKSNINIK